MFLWNIAVTSLAEVWIEIFFDPDFEEGKKVTSLAEVWIEIDRGKLLLDSWFLVTSLAEVWIEIVIISMSG